MPRKVDILIQAKNGVSGPVKDANSALSKLGRTSGSLSGPMGKARGALEALGMGAGKATMLLKTAVVGAVAAAVGAMAKAAAKLANLWDAQSRAERKLATIHSAFGENATRFVAAEKRIASAIQDEIGVGDESVLGMMARIRMMGTSAASMGKATRATYALTAAGFDEASAARAVAMAMRGEYTMLARLSPEIRNAKTEQEKLAAFNRLTAAGYKALQADMNSLAGATRNLKGRLGDLGEQFGRVVNGSNWMGRSINWLAGQVKKATDAMSPDEPLHLLDPEEFQKDKEGLQRVYALYDRLIRAKRLYAEIEAEKEGAKNAQKELKGWQRLVRDQEEREKGLRELVGKSFKENMAGKKQKRKEEQEKAKAEKENARMSKKAARWAEMERQGAHLTQMQRDAVQVWKERGDALGWDNERIAFEKRIAPNHRLDIGAGMGELARADINKANQGRAEKAAEAAQDRLEELPTLSDVKTEIERLTKALQDAKGESVLYQREQEKHEADMAEKIEGLESTLESVDQSMQGLSDYLKQSLRGV